LLEEVVNPPWEYNDGAFESEKKLPYTRASMHSANRLAGNAGVPDLRTASIFHVPQTLCLPGRIRLREKVAFIIAPDRLIVGPHPQ
jgi:hypothetical protein